MLWSGTASPTKVVLKFSTLAPMTTTLVVRHLQAWYEAQLVAVCYNAAAFVRFLDASL